MIDCNNEVFSTVAFDVRLYHPDATMTGEYIRRPSAFPCVALDETQNVEVENLNDSGRDEVFAGVSYKLQVFSNKQGEKKAEARAIFATADAALRKMGFHRVTYTTTPEIYDSTIYNITATYEAIVSRAGYVYKR